MSLYSKFAAELIGTFVLVLGGCGTAIFAAKFPETGVGFVGVAIAFGLTVLAMVYAVGHISGGHFNSAVTVGLVVGGRTPWADLVPYLIAQLIGAIIAAAILYVIASGKAGFSVSDGFAANGYGAHSPMRCPHALCQNLCSPPSSFSSLWVRPTVVLLVASVGWLSG